jgi:hypothetical protein
MRRAWLLGFAVLACKSEGLTDGQGGAAEGGRSGGAGNGAVSNARGGSGGAGGVHSSRFDVVTATGGVFPDCGPGCRIALRGPIAHAPGWGHGYTADAVSDTGRGRLMYAALGSDETLLLRQGIYAVDDPSDLPTLAVMSGRHLAYTSVTWPNATITVYDRVTKLHSSYFDYDQETLGVFQLLLGPEHVFWLYPGGTGRATLATGEVVEFPDRFACTRACVMGQRIVCANEAWDRIQAIEPSTLKGKLIDDGGAMQIESGCSPGGERMVWVDYRDPPGPESTRSGRRAGGEIYMYDAASDTTSRLTHDLPARSVPKTRPTVGTDLAVWRETCATCPETYQFAQEFYALARDLIKYDLETGERCRFSDIRFGGWMSLHGHHLYAYWTDDLEQYLVDLDLDSPEIPWVCELGR